MLTVVLEKDRIGPAAGILGSLLGIIAGPEAGPLERIEGR